MSDGPDTALQRGAAMRRIGSPITLIAVAALIIAFYAELVWHLPSAAFDFHIFYAAASVMRHGGNPYDIHQLYQQERCLFPYLAHNAAQQEWMQQNPFVQGPILLVSLLPVTLCPLNAAYAIWFALLACAVALALVCLVRACPMERRSSRALWLLISPVTFLGPFYGQADAFMLLAWVLALWFASRNNFMLAGAIVTAGLIKPQIMAGSILLLAMMAWHRGGLVRYVGGLFLGLLVSFAIVTPFAPPTLFLAWLTSMIHFSHADVYAQSDISSLTALYIRWLPRTWDASVAAMILLAWAIACVRMSRHSADEANAVWFAAIGLVGWLLVTPYAHPHDDVMLLPAMWIAYIASRKDNARRILMVALQVAWWILPLTYPLGIAKYVPLPIAGLGVVPIVALCAVSWSQRPALRSSGRMAPVKAWSPG